MNPEVGTQYPASKASQLANDSGVTGASVKDALNTLQTEISGIGGGSGNVNVTTPTTQYNVPYWKDTAGGLSASSPIVVHMGDDGAVGKVERTVGSFDAFATAADGATVTFNFDGADKQQVTLGGNRTLAYVAFSLNKGQRIVVRLIQDATGGRTVTWFSGVNWHNNQAPILDPTPNGTDVIELECVAVDTYGVATLEEISRKTSAPRKTRVVATDGATVTFNLDISPKQKVTLGGNRTLALAGTLTAGRLFSVKATQDGTGSRTVTWWSGITWAAGSPPTLSTAAGASDVFGFEVTGAGTYDGYVLGQGL